jgi:hypothetical protein
MHMSILHRDPPPDDVPSILVCVPVGWAHVPGSTRGVCAHCGAAVWIAPSGREELAKSPAMQVLCLDDGLQRLQTDSEAYIAPATPAQWRELEAYWRQQGR